jgi:hypothetical protein
MTDKLIRPDEAEDAAIARGIASDPDAAPDLSAPIQGIVRRPGDDERELLSPVQRTHKVRSA